MAAKTEAQEEFDNLFKPARGPNRHPEDERDQSREDPDELDEETRFKQSQVDNDMRSLSLGGAGRLRLPDESFDKGRTTGVKGVIADARAYQQAKREGSRKTNSKEKSGRITGSTSYQRNNKDGTSFLDDHSEDEDEDEEFLEKWREERRREMVREGNDIRNRRNSPSVRRYGKFDDVDAAGYLDAIEKVGRETVVAVFVYDDECPVSQIIEEALEPLVATNPAVHFVKVHYQDIEFDNAGVPAILAYKNQGDLIANLTYIIDQIPEDTLFDTKALKDVLKKHKIL